MMAVIENIRIENGYEPRNFQLLWRAAGNENYRASREATQEEISRLVAEISRRKSGRNGAKVSQPAKEVAKPRNGEMAKEVSPRISQPVHETAQIHEISQPAKDACESGEISQENEKAFAAKVAVVFRDILLWCVPVAHSFLVWYDAVQMFGAVGHFVGVVFLALNGAAIFFASDPAMNRTSSNFLWAVGVAEAAAVFIHVPVFSDAMQMAGVQSYHIWGCAIFICLFSWWALFLYRDSKQV